MLLFIFGVYNLSCLHDLNLQQEDENRFLMCMFCCIFKQCQTVTILMQLNDTFNLGRVNIQSNIKDLLETFIIYLFRIHQSHIQYIITSHSLLMCLKISSTHITL